MNLRMPIRRLAKRFGVYLIALLLPALALAVQHAIFSRVGGAPTLFLLSYPTIFFIAWFGGVGPGLLATAVILAGDWYLFLPPYDSFAMPQTADLIKMVVFGVMAVALSIILPLSETKRRRLYKDFLTLLEHTSDFIYFKDKSSRIRFCSRALANLCGYRNWRKMVGKHDFEIFPEEIASIYYEEELPVFREGKPLLNKIDPYIDKNGDRRLVSTNKWPVFDDEGNVVGIFGISRDITERVEAEKELRRQVGRSEMLLRSASDGIHILNKDGDIVEANDVFCRMLGYTRAQLLELNVMRLDVQWSEREVKRKMLEVLEEPRIFETLLRRSDGQVVDVEISAAGIDIEGERLIFSSARDITERKRNEAKLRRLAAELSEANRLKDIFTDVLRHDILNPITAIRVSTELLLLKESDTNKADILRKVRQSTQNLSEMTESAAKLASIRAGQAFEVSSADPVQVLRSVLPDFEHDLKGKNMRLADRSVGGFSASFNPSMADVFSNLISNAIKYSPPETEIELAVEDRGETWTFWVKDQGIGVPDEHKQRIFNRFVRLGREGVKGSGLGLTIAKQIVSLHGGDIWLEDNPGGGSVFRVRVPKISQTGDISH